MASKNRETLKNYFKKGGFATEKEFSDLIDSSMNLIDDGISMTPRQGLKLNPLGSFSRVISFFKKKSQKNPEFSVEIDDNDLEGLSVNNSDGKSIIKIKKSNQIGINTDKPENTLDVNGTIGIKTRVGLYKIGEISADGKWHKIIDNLDGLNIFEITARIDGKKLTGQYSLLHAIALSAYGGKRSKSSIKSTSARWGGFFESYRNKIKLRWTGDIHSYSLEMKSVRNWGINDDSGEFFNIKFNVCKLIE